MKTKWWNRVSYFAALLAFVIFLCVGVLMAHHTPYSGRAYVEIGVVPVYSKVAGVIEEIYVLPDRPIKRNDPIFKLDDRNYAAEVQRLEALLAYTSKQLQALDAQIVSAEEEERKAENIRQQAQIDLERDTRLFSAKVVAARTLEESKLAFRNAQQDLLAAQARTATLRSQRGNPAEESCEEKQLQAELAVARNNRNDTVIRAPEEGLLDYHQLYRGQAVNTQEHYAVIHDTGKLRVNVDLLEKSAGALKIGQPALVTFDMLPNRLFRARISGFVRLVQSKYTGPTQLNEIDEDTRWIRSAGRIRVQLQLEDAPPEEITLTTGSKAATAFLSPASPNLSMLNRLWIELVAFCNYIY